MDGHLLGSSLQGAEGKQGNKKCFSEICVKTGQIADFYREKYE
jgi:hypothetical protein